jgi:HlyD family secretion protein
VEARIVTWSAASVLKVPASAVFRRAAGSRDGPGSGSLPAEAQDWAVFTVEEGRAKLRPVVPGHRTAAEVEVLKGIAAGELVVLHPQNELRDGARVTTR